MANYNSQQDSAILSRDARKASLLSTHTVLRNTYFLLSMTLLWSAFIAWGAMVLNAPYPGLIISLFGVFGLMFLTMKTRNSIWGLVNIFLFTGFIGYTMGPLLNFYIKSFSNGGELIMMSLGGTGVIFFSLSAYVLTTRKNMNFLGGFLFTGLIIGVIAMIANIFLKIPALQLGISAAFVLIFSGFILYDTSRIINNGERNYIMATISLYLSIINLFQYLLMLLSAFSGNRN